MPSKPKKHSKSAYRLSNADQPASPRTPSSTLTSSPDLVASEHDFISVLEEASSRYPSLIGKSALISLVIDVEHESRGCRIWLSESSMVASSLSPGSIVSVSLVDSCNRFLDGFPLSSISGEYIRQSEVDFEDETANEVGNYFALATVFPSQKVSKNGVHLSSSLSYTMGCPTSGRVVFVYPIQSQFLTNPINEKNTLHTSKIDDTLLHNCNKLTLELFAFKNRVGRNSDMMSTISIFAQKMCNSTESGTISSPRTPFYQSKLNSPSITQLSSPKHEEGIYNLSNPDGKSVDSFGIKEALKDESARKLLQACATSWLNSRILICGNLVALPILFELCIFRVTSVNKLPAGCTSQDLMNERRHELHPQDPELVDPLKDVFMVNSETKVYLSLPMSSTTETQQQRGLPFMEMEGDHVETIVGHDISKLGGLSKEYAVLKDVIISSMKNTLLSLGIRTTKGVLIYGPPGTGKTSLAHLCAHESGVNLFSVNGPEIISQYHGESEQAICEVFDSACRAAPAVVFIDELDAIASARKDGSEELSQRMVATLLNLMDGISRTDGLIVIAATNRPDSIEPALRRPGRFDREIEIGVPSPKQRLDILQILLGEMEHSLSDVQVQHLAMVTHGFVGADLAALCNEAALVCLRHYAKSKESCKCLHFNRSSIAYEDCSDSMIKRSGCSSERRDNRADSASSSVPDLTVSFEILPSSSLSRPVSEVADNIENITSTSYKEAFLLEKEHVLKVTFEDFEKARMKVRPSAMREVILEVPKVNWEDVGGQREVKRQLMEAVEWPQRHQDAFKRIGTCPSTGVLMFGPPGCSKTLMARAVASEAGLNFLAVKGPELYSKWVGESEKAVRSIFAKARANAPSIIFFDEIDGLAVIRGKESDGVSVSDRVTGQLLVELDGLHQRVNVVVIAATNRPDKIDSALLRPGRFDRLIYVGPPNETDREDIFRIHLRKIPCSSDVSIKRLACLTEGCTGADIALICREAAIAAIEESIDASEITMQHLKAAIRQVQPTEIQSYQDLSTKFGRHVHSSNAVDGLGCQTCSNRSNWFPIWSLIQSAMQILHQFLASGSKSGGHKCASS